MFVAGETGEPSEETTTLIETIVRNMVMDVVRPPPPRSPPYSPPPQIITARDLAAQRSAPRFNTNDILFQFRKDPERLGRLEEYLQSRKIRSTAAKSDKEASGEVDITLDGNDDDDDLPHDGDDIDSDHANSDNDHQNSTASSNLRLQNGNGKTTPTTTMTTTDAPSLHLPWPFPATLLTTIPIDPHPHPLLPSSDLALHLHKAKLSRLQQRELRTATMSPSEYIQYAYQCRSSFISRKCATFRSWCGLGEIADHQKREDVPGLLNLLAVEWVEALTVEALRVKAREGEWEGVGHRGGEGGDGNGSGSGGREIGEGEWMGVYLFDVTTSLSEGFLGRAAGERKVVGTVVELRHIREAHWRLRNSLARPLILDGVGGHCRKKRKLVG